MSVMAMMLHSSHTLVLQHSHPISEATPVSHPVFSHLDSVSWLAMGFFYTDCMVLTMSLGCGARIHYYVYRASVYEVLIDLD